MLGYMEHIYNADGDTGASHMGHIHNTDIGNAVANHMSCMSDIDVCNTVVKRM